MRALAVLPLLLLVAAASAVAEEGGRAAATRIVSLNPSLTAILLAIGAGPTLVGVDEYSSRQQAAVRSLPTVGGLFNPSLESVVALSPDLVVLVPGAQQRDLQARLEALGIEAVALPNVQLEELLGSIDELGRLTGREAQARERVAAIRREWARVARQNDARPKLRAVLVIQREPLFVVGRGSFLDDMLRAAGAENPASSFEEPYPRVSVEWLLAVAPEVILDASQDPSDAATWWSRWPSLPAVASGRVVAVPAAEVTLPGPYVERGLKRLADALHAAPAGGPGPAADGAPPSATGGR